MHLHTELPNYTPICKSRGKDKSQGVEFYHILSIMIAGIRLIIPLIVIGGNGD